ncbi:MAG: hypothetical protein CSA22_05240 [Deltaproteobacteria bacterium]|nr:MAG: hypothetical protein CSA22_05240 [Deltaproteobacteria bacterium]
MKKCAVFSLTAVVSLVLFTGGVCADTYKPGTYTGSATGYSRKNHPGKIEVEVTVDANAIKAINILTYEQTTTGKQTKQIERTLQAKTQIPAQIIEKQSLAVDSVARASASSVGIELAVAQALEKATLTYKDGTYTGEAKGYDRKKHPGKIEVEVTVTGGRIAEINIVTYEQTTTGKQAQQIERTLQAKADIPGKIIARQTTAVDSIARASMSSDGIKLAVARALEKAR